MRRVARALAVVVVLALPAVADVVRPPPASCPGGGLPASNHNGPHCAPGRCPARGCPKGTSCQEVALCVATLPCRGDAPPTCRFDSVAGPCDKGACAEGAACRTVTTCAPTPPAPAGRVPSCAAGGGGSGLGSWVLVLALLVTLRRRSR